MFKTLLHWSESRGQALGWSRAGALVLWGETDAPRLFQPAEEVAVGDLTAALIAMGRSARTQNQALHSSEWLEDKRTYTWIKRGKFRQKNIFSCVDSQIMGQIAQAGHTVLVLTCFQDPTGHSLGHPCLTSDLALLWAGGWTKAFPRSFPSELSYVSIRIWLT